MKPVVIFDGDDTLWWAEELYDTARQRAAHIVREAGLDPVLWEQVERRIDVENVERFGLSSERFPTSCADAYRIVAAEEGRTTSDAIASEVYTAATWVFEAKARPVQGAREALAAISSDVELALLTKGDPAIQRKRIAESELEAYFSRIVIVGEKDAAAFSTVLEQFDAEPKRSWSVGNSLRSDILPALRLGMNAAWIDAHVWEHERTHIVVDDARVVEISEIGQLPSVIRSHLSSTSVG